MNYLEIVGTVVGIIYLILEYRASIYLWIVGIIMPAIYVFVYYKVGLYADFCLNIYYLLAGIYGWIIWKFKRTTDGVSVSNEMPITRLPVTLYIPLTFVFIVSWLSVAYILARFTDSDVVWLDSLIVAFSVIGMWLLARKYIEQWLPWIAADVISTWLFMYKGLYFTAGLYAIYSIIAIFGYVKWKQMMKK